MLPVSNSPLESFALTMNAPNPGASNFESLYSNHHGWLQMWLRRRLDNAHDAADLAHDTFERLLTAPASTPEKQAGWALAEPRTYLTVVAKRLLANLHRRRSLEQAYLEALESTAETLAPSPEQSAVILETLQEIDTLLDGLPAKMRGAFLLAQFDGMTYAAIAVELAVSERTVKRYMAEAMAQCILLME